MNGYLKKFVTKLLFRFSKEGIEIKRLRQLKRHTRTQTNLLSVPFQLVDNASFIGQYFEIIKKEIYRFDTPSARPYIIDCGANVGSSIYYFKKRFPNAKILAFEPDGTVFEVLQQNVKSMGVQDVELINQAVLNTEGTVNFYSDGTDAGSIMQGNSKGKLVQVQATRLRSYLTTKVDFLKLDIEGSESLVLQDCADLLGNVDKIFIEYHSVYNKKQELDIILKLLSDHGFRYFIEQVNIFNANPYIKKRKLEQYDNLLNIYAQKDIELAETK